MLRQRQTLVHRLERHGALAGMPARVAIIGRDADAVGLIMSNMSGVMPVPPTTRDAITAALTSGQYITRPRTVGLTVGARF